MNPNALTVHDVAEQLSVSTKTVYKMAKTGELDSYNVGRKLFFTQSAIDALVGAAPLPSAKLIATPNNFFAEGEASELFAALPADQNDFLIGGSDICASVIAGKLCERGVKAGLKGMSSYSSLVHLYLGDVDACVVRLFDQKTKTYNTPYVRRLVPGTPVKLIRVCSRLIGLCVRKNAPSNIKSLAGAVRNGAAFANQKAPADSRIFLDECLSSIEAVQSAVSGYATEYESDFAAVGAVANGEADVCIASIDVASRFSGVRFVALSYEQVDLVVRRDKRLREFNNAIRDLMADKSMAASLEAVSKCDTAKLGQVVLEV
jgi:putative molybdopterin biosynthesis protein